MNSLPEQSIEVIFALRLTFTLAESKLIVRIKDFKNIACIFRRFGHSVV